MIKEFFKHTLIPYIEQLKNHQSLQFLGHLLHEPNLWHINRHSLSVGMGVGLFCALIPLPFQMLWAALGAIALRGNLPLAAILVWLSNPLTTPPIYYVSYQIGSLMMGIHAKPIDFHNSSDLLSPMWWMQTLESIWEPWLLGLMTLAVLSALVGYLAVQWLWRLHIVILWYYRRKRRAQQPPANPS